MVVKKKEHEDQVAAARDARSRKSKSNEKWRRRGSIKKVVRFIGEDSRIVRPGTPIEE